MLKYVLIAFAAVSIAYLIYVFRPKGRTRDRDKPSTGNDGSPYSSDPTHTPGGKDCGDSATNDSSYGDCGSSDGGGDGGGGDGGD